MPTAASGFSLTSAPEEVIDYHIGHIDLFINPTLMAMEGSKKMLCRFFFFPVLLPAPHTERPVLCNVVQINLWFFNSEVQCCILAHWPRSDMPHLLKALARPSLSILISKLGLILVTIKGTWLGRFRESEPRGQPISSKCSGSTLGPAFPGSRSYDRSRRSEITWRIKSEEWQFTAI